MSGPLRQDENHCAESEFIEEFSSEGASPRRQPWVEGTLPLPFPSPARAGEGYSRLRRCSASLSEVEGKAG